MFLGDVRYLINDDHVPGNAVHGFIVSPTVCEAW